ncbi:MAG: hypothetical protein ACI4ES_07760 [Roseburia sp.]
MEFRHLWKSNWRFLLILLLILNGILFFQSEVSLSYDKETYLENYTEYLAQIGDSADTLSGISIFSNQSTYSYQNIQRTKEAFASCQELKLTTTNDTALEQMLSWNWSYFFVLILLILAAEGLLTERKNGFWEVTYAETKHRKKYAVKKITALFVVSVMVQTLFLGSEFLLGMIRFGGWSDLFSMVQSSMLFQHFPVAMNKVAFLLLYLGASILGSFLAALVIYVCFSAFYEPFIGYLFAMVLGGLEAICMLLIPEHSFLRVFRSVNLVTAFLPQRYLLYYENWGAGSFLVNVWLLMAVAAAVLFLGLSVFVIQIQEKKRPCGTGNRLEKFTARLLQRIHEKFASTSLFWKECYKTYVVHGGIVVLLAIGIFSWKNNQVDTVSYNDGEKLYQQFCQNYEGVPGKETATAYKEWQAEIEGQNQKLEEAKEAYQQGELSAEEYALLMFDVGGSGGTVMGLSYLEENMTYLRQLYRQKGIRGGLLVQESYNYLWGEKGEKREKMNLALVLAAILFLGYRSFSEDRENLVYTLYRSTKKGCTLSYRAKNRAGICGILLVVILVYGMDLGILAHSFGLPGLSLPVQSLYCFERFAIQMSIGSYLALWMVLRIVDTIALYEVVKWLSIFLRNSWKCFFLSALLLLLVWVIGYENCTVSIPLAGILAGIAGKRSWKTGE